MHSSTNNTRTPGFTAEAAINDLATTIYALTAVDNNSNTIMRNAAIVPQAYCWSCGSCGTGKRKCQDAYGRTWCASC